MHELLFEGRTEFQDAKIFANAHLGKVLVLDNVVQTTLGDEFVYHEMMAHTPLFAHGAPKTALIIGGGDGGLLNEALKHPTIEQITMVELMAALSISQGRICRRSATARLMIHAPT